MADIAGDGPPNKRQKIASPALTPSGSESGILWIIVLVNIFAPGPVKCYVHMRLLHFEAFVLMPIFRKSSLILDFCLLPLNLCKIIKQNIQNEQFRVLVWNPWETGEILWSAYWFENLFKWLQLKNHSPVSQSWQQILHPDWRIIFHESYPHYFESDPLSARQTVLLYINS